MFALPDLPYEYNELEPHIDAQTMELHYSKHHRTYVDKLNVAIKDTGWEDRPIEEILQNIGQLPHSKQIAVQNNGGGHYNHTMFWSIMSPNGGGEPSGKLKEKIDKSFEGFASFKDMFKEAAVARFGSGWVWLIEQDGGLGITSTPNQDSPIMQGIVPLLALDVWEHAYYLKYQNRRPDYVDNWWNVVNWLEVEKRLS